MLSPKENHVLNKTLATAGIVSALVFGFAAPSFAGAQDFTIINKTGMTFQEVYVEASDAEEWGEDVLGEEALPNGGEFEVAFEGYGKECKFDIMLVDSKGTEWTVEQLDLCEIHEFVLTKKGKGLIWSAK